jgi:hypothetical protein
MCKIYSEEELKKIAAANGLTVSFAENIIYVRTNVARWRLVHNKKQVTKILHENYRTNLSSMNNHNFKSGFHEHKLEDRSFENVFNYILRHDKKFFRNSPFNADQMFKRALNKKYVML